MIVFVGSNPSNAAHTLDPFTPETRSYKVLLSWIVSADIIEYKYINIANIKTHNNKALTIREIRDNISRIKDELNGFTKIVALGKTAQTALELAAINHLKIPHPSGRNRLLNDTAYVEECIEKLRAYAK